MDDPDSTYAPQSPDLSGCNASYTAPTFQLPPLHLGPTPFNYQYLNHDPVVMVGNGRTKPQEEDEDWMPEPSTRTSSRKSKRIKVEQVGFAPGAAEGIEVKTKFPVARIKRIMQADEDVGKVAQVTPVAVCECPSFLSRCRQWC